MIKNIRCFNDLITIDFSLNQIRFIKNYFLNEEKQIKFIDISPTEANILGFANDEKFFKKRLRDILRDNGIDIYLNFMRVLKC